MRRERTQRAFRKQGAARLSAQVDQHFSVDSLSKAESGSQQTSHHRKQQQQQQRSKSKSSFSNHLEQLFVVFGIAFVLIYGYYQMMPLFLAAHGEKGTGAINPQLKEQFIRQQRRTPDSSGTATTTHHGGGLKAILDKNPFLPKPGEYAPLRQDTVIPLVKFQTAPTKEYHIFCVSSQADMAATILTNIAMALFDRPDEHLGIVSWSNVGNQYVTKKENEFVSNNVTIVSHVVQEPGGDIVRLLKHFRPIYRNVFFLVVNRGQDECLVPNEQIMMCISPQDLLYQQGIQQEKLVIGRLVQRLQQELPYFGSVNFGRQQLEALRRLDFMYDMMLQMRDLPAATSEVKYGIHGGLTTS